MSQFVFDLPARKSLDGADFLVAPSNRAAVAMIDRWPDWPAHALALVGPEACGKSHLAAVWRARSGADLPGAQAIAARSRAMRRDRPAVLLEDVDRGLRAGSIDAVDLFHLHNWLRERGGFLLLTGREPPARWPTALPDLASRLTALPVAQISAPDDDLLAALLVKQLTDRQVRVEPKLVEFVLARIERSFAAVAATVALLDRESLRRRRPITVPLARELLGQAAESPAADDDAGSPAHKHRRS